MTVKVATPATLPRQAPVIKLLRLTLRKYHQRRIMKNYEEEMESKSKDGK
jgi:hypothetical protein